MSSLALRSTRVVTPDGLRAATVHVAGGTIERVAPHEDGTPVDRVSDLGALVLMPGLVDSHVHVNEPGRTEWEGFRTATRAAAAGGVTTIVDMPLNSIPPTTDPDALRVKRDAAAGQAHVDVAFWGGVVPGNARHLADMRAAGVPGFKCFLLPSGVDEFEHVEESDLREAMPRLAEIGAVLLVHAEMPGPIEEAVRVPPGSPCCYASWLAQRPPEAELEAVELLVRLCRDTGARVHVVHLANGDAIGRLADARAEGLPIGAETCPHYLSFDADAIPDRATAFKCAPPIRERVHRDALWDGLAEGILDLVVTDHSPSTPELERIEEGDFLAAWGGIASLQVGLAAVWSRARERGVPLERVVAWMSGGPARLAGLDDRKGAIAPGLDADLVAFDPDGEREVHGAELEHRHPVTPYEGERLAGVVHRTWLRGELVYDGRRGVLDAPRGRLLEAGS